MTTWKKAEEKDGKERVAFYHAMMKIISDPDEWAKRAICDGDGNILGFFLDPEHRDVVINSLNQSKQVITMLESMVVSFEFISNPETEVEAARSVAMVCAGHARRYADLFCKPDSPAQMVIAEQEPEQV